VSKRRSRRSSLTADAAKTAVYIDFEGLKRFEGEIPPPRLLGVLIGKRYRGIVLTDWSRPRDRFRPLVNGACARGWDLTFARLDEAMREICELCESQDRVMLAYSIAEQQRVDEHCDPEVARRVRRRLRNAKPFIQRWRNVRHGGDNPADRSLESYLRMIGFDAASSPRGGPAACLRRLNTAVGRTRRWQSLPEQRRQDWLDLLAYNRDDCQGLQRLVVQATNSLAQTAGKR
jgi:hypothetical protein